jgi:assimilatory nitrate reductase catalytic subunit
LDSPLENPVEVFEELRRASAGGADDYSGIIYERIRKEDGIFWPCPSEDHPGTPRLFLERFATGDGRARFHAVNYQPAAEEPDHEYPLYLTTGRIMARYRSGTQTRLIAVQMQSAPDAFVQILMNAPTPTFRKDGRFSVVPQIPGGITSPAQLRRIADVAERFA